MRVILGASRDFDCDTGEIKDLQKIQLANISLRMALPDYYNRSISLNSLPQSWFNAIVQGDAKQIKSTMAMKVTASPTHVDKKSKDVKD